MYECILALLSSLRLVILWWCRRISSRSSLYTVVEADNFEFVVSWAKRIASIWDIPFSLTIWATFPYPKREGLVWYEYRLISPHGHGVLERFPPFPPSLGYTLPLHHAGVSAPTHPVIGFMAGWHRQKCGFQFAFTVQTAQNLASWFSGKSLKLLPPDVRF